MPYRFRNVSLVLLGVAALVLKRHYAGPGQEAVASYGGNAAASFAVYFVVANLPFRAGWRKVLTAGLALAAVELFEATDGFGVMANVYDPIDFAANAAGVALASVVDATTRGPAEHGRGTG